MSFCYLQLDILCELRTPSAFTTILLGWNQIFEAAIVLRFQQILPGNKF